MQKDEDKGGADRQYGECQEPEQGGGGKEIAGPCFTLSRVVPFWGLACLSIPSSGSAVEVMGSPIRTGQYSELPGGRGSMNPLPPAT